MENVMFFNRKKVVKVHLIKINNIKDILITIQFKEDESVTCHTTFDILTNLLDDSFVGDFIIAPVYVSTSQFEEAHVNVLAIAAYSTKYDDKLSHCYDEDWNDE